ncbi:MULTISPECIES: hypothetical protein [unclassified Streptomyces]|uniref:hypothetical protein n=1 Tax=unclassified Streptomyces TaxID=2593676 RepID=UPI00381D5A66
MTPQDEITEVRRRLDDLIRTVERLERTLAHTHRRTEPLPRRADELVTIPDTPYDNTLWTDSDDEGLGVRDRRAP